MNFKIFKYLPVFLMVFTFCSYAPPTENDRKNTVMLELIMQGLQSSHFEAIEINDEFSEKAFDLYLERLDATKRFLVQSDVEKLKAYRTKIDDQIRQNSFEFFDFSEDLINKRVKEAEGYYQKILSKPFDFKKDEQIELDTKKREFPADEAAQKEEWRKYLKYQTMTRLLNAVERQEKALKENDETVEQKKFATLEKEAREGVKKSHDDLFSRLNRLEEEDRLTVYINAILNTYDPHTSYFPPQDKENFDISMSGQLEGIGATLQEKDGYITVQRIVPGSASHRQGELEVSDMILKVGQGSDEPVDIVDMRLDKAVKLIRGKKGTEVRLTVKKLDGTITVIPIIRDIVIIEETYAKSALLKHPDSEKKIGYIQLPSFYADFNNKGGRSSSTDVANELEKLKAQNISGLVIDLRNNGGGSLQDVVDMAGLFIESGPIVQIKARKGAPYVLADEDPAVQYEGPLVVMVNEFSASASEIMAAAMQDYKRAVIMGSKSTFGKGTVQQFVELDRFLPAEYNDLKPLGSVKLTLQKFYRINGDATQLRGVTPDIILPDAYQYLEVGEKELDHPMQWSQIQPVNYSTWTTTAPLEVLEQQSMSRINTNHTFEMVQANARRLDEQSKKTLYPLHLEKYRAHQEKVKEEADKYKNVQKEIEGFTVLPMPHANPEASMDTTRIAMIEEFYKNIRKDVHLFEATSVLQDMK